MQDVQVVDKKLLKVNKLQLESHLFSDMIKKLMVDGLKYILQLIFLLTSYTV